MSRCPYTITLSDADREYLQKTSQCRTSPAHMADRSRILLKKEKGHTGREIAQGLDISINTVRLCIQKYHKGGVKATLSDAGRSGHPVEITDDAMHGSSILPASVPQTSDTPRSCGRSRTYMHIQIHASEAGFPRLETISKARVGQLLKKSEIKPFKIKYYCEKRDPLFESKM